MVLLFVCVMLTALWVVPVGVCLAIVLHGLFLGLVLVCFKCRCLWFVGLIGNGGVVVIIGGYCGLLAGIAGWWLVITAGFMVCGVVYGLLVAL